MILKIILKNLIVEKEFKEDTKREILYWVAFYDKRSNQGSKAFMHLEALYARLMLIIYKDKVGYNQVSN